MGQAAPPLTHMCSFKTLFFEAAPDTDCPLENTDTFRVPHQETERCSRERQTKPHSWPHSCGLSQLSSPLTFPWVSSHNVPSVLAPRQFTSESRPSQPLNQLIVPMQASWGRAGSSSTHEPRVRGPDNGDSRGACGSGVIWVPT